MPMPIEDISLQPKLSSPGHFRIQGGSPERYGEGRTEDRNPGVLYSISNFFPARTWIENTRAIRNS